MKQWDVLIHSYLTEEASSEVQQEVARLLKQDKAFAQQYEEQKMVHDLLMQQAHPQLSYNFADNVMSHIALKHVAEPINLSLFYVLAIMASVLLLTYVFISLNIFSLGQNINSGYLLYASLLMILFSLVDLLISKQNANRPKTLI